MSRNVLEYAVELRDGVSPNLKKIDKNVDKTERGFGGLTSSIKGVLGVAAGLATIGVATAGIRSIFNTTAEFQKFEAVLTNTFQSADKASQAMKDIQTFAANTPYGVNELTNSFVKLANRGFVPTMNEMTKLGDLAGSLGKPFDQLVEAVLDAETMEFERLKEFGIKARQQGDQVSLTFKGQTTTINKTADAMRGYVLGLGDVVGVQGSMAAVSKTLEGQYSNLMDTIDMLSVKVGMQLADSFSGGINAFSGFVQWISDGIDWMVKFKTEITAIFKPLSDAFQPLIEAFNEVYVIMGLNATQGTLLQGVFEAIGTVITLIAPLIKSVLQYAGAIIKAIAKVSMAIWDFVNGNQTVLKFVAGMVSGIQTLFIELGKSAQSIFGGIGDLLVGIFTMDTDKIKSGLKSALTGLKDVAIDLVPKAYAAYNDAIVGKEYKNLSDAVGFKSPFGNSKESLIDETGSLNPNAAGGGSGGSGLPSAKNASLKSGINTIKGGAPRVFNLNIESLIKENVNQFQNAGIESKNRIKQIVLEALTEAVNDAQEIAVG